VDGSMVLTVLVITVLELFAKEFETEWSMMAKKSRRLVKTKIGAEQFESLRQQMLKFVPSLSG
jgi:hypothetical protein